MNKETVIVLDFGGQYSIVCCQKENIDRFSLNNYFPAQSLRFRYGSAAPCHTLRAYVTSSPPRTRCGRTATPYPTGFTCCVLPAYKDCSHSQWKTAFALFSQFAPIPIYTTRGRFAFNSHFLVLLKINGIMMSEV